MTGSSKSARSSFSVVLSGSSCTSPLEVSRPVLLIVTSASSSSFACGSVLQPLIVTLIGVSSKCGAGVSVRSSAMTVAFSTLIVSACTFQSDSLDALDDDASDDGGPSAAAVDAPASAFAVAGAFGAEQAIEAERSVGFKRDVDGRP